MIIKTLNKALLCICIRATLIELSWSLKARDYFLLLSFRIYASAFDRCLMVNLWLHWTLSLMSGCFDGDLWCKLRMYQLVVFACSCVFMFTLSTNLQCHSWCPHNFFIFLFNFMHMLYFVHFHIKGSKL